MNVKTTERGFAVAEFADYNGVKCSIQKSSLATEDCIWLGADDIGLKKFKAYEGWSDVPLPFSFEEHYTANNRMHLTQEQVKALLPLLTHFAETGELAAIEAALAATPASAEPVAWRWKHPNEPAWKVGPNHPEWDEDSPYIVEPLYAGLEVTP